MTITGPKVCFTDEHHDHAHLWKQSWPCSSLKTTCSQIGPFKMSEILTCINEQDFNAFPDFESHHVAVFLWQVWFCTANLILFFLLMFALYILVQVDTMTSVD